MQWGNVVVVFDHKTGMPKGLNLSIMGGLVTFCFILGRGISRYNVYSGFFKATGWSSSLQGTKTKSASSTFSRWSE